MGFRQEREKERRKRRKLYLKLGGVALIMAAAFLVVTAFYPAATWKYYVYLPDVSARKAGQARIHFVDVGQGDSTIIELPDGKTMLIDGGDGKKAHTNAIMRYLNALNVKKVDYMVLTHPDSDHAGGLDTVLKYKKVDVVYYPYVTNYAVNAEYEQFIAALVKSGAERKFSQIGENIQTSGENAYRLTFLSPSVTNNPKGEYAAVNGGDESGEALNDTSAVIWFEYSGVRALFCGDAGDAVEQKLLDLDNLAFGMMQGCEGVSLRADILKVSHHGAGTATSLQFLDRLGVRSAFISCGKDNLYGHPDGALLARLALRNIAVYRTDEQGNVVVTIENGRYRVS